MTARGRTTVRVIIAFFFMASLIVSGCAGNDANDDADQDCLDSNKYDVPLGEADLTFHVGPYIMHTTSTWVAISWETKESGDTLVQYGLREPGEHEAKGESGTMHRAVLKGLHPDTVYKYKACTSGRCTKELTFATAPSLGVPFRFVVYGDSRSDPAMHANVVSEIIKAHPAVVINVGDIVERGDHREQFKDMHFDPTRALGQRVPIYVSIGNHEFKGDRQGTYFKDYMMYPGDEDLPDQPSGDDLPPHPEFSYAVRYGDAFFLILDDTMDALDLFSPVEGYDPPLWLWLKRQVESEAARTAKWRFAFMHYPPNSVCPHDNTAPYTAVEADVVPLLRENGFHALFTGHVHDYERMDYDGFPVFITGGGGAGLEDLVSCTGELDESRTLASVHHYMVVDLDCEQASIKAIDVAGNLLDEVVIEPSGNGD